MSDRLTAWIRSAVPAGWSAVVAWLVGLGLPSDLVQPLGSLGAVVLVPLAYAAVYAVARWVEAQSWTPKWLVTLLLGVARTPTYTPAPAPVVAPAAK